MRRLKEIFCNMVDEFLEMQEVLTHGPMPWSRIVLTAASVSEKLQIEIVFVCASSTNNLILFVCFQKTSQVPSKLQKLPWGYGKRKRASDLLKNDTKIKHFWSFSEQQGECQNEHLSLSVLQ